MIGAESSTIYIERAHNTSLSVVDSVQLDPLGRFRLNLEGVEQTPHLYNIKSDGASIPLFLMAKDRVVVNTIGNISSNYRVEGSSESELLRQFYQPYQKGLMELERVAGLYAMPDLDDERRKELARMYGAEYQRIRQAQLRFIIENKSSLAAVYALYQRVGNDQYLFNESSDLIYFRTVAEAIAESYPTSCYLEMLHEAIASMESTLLTM